MRHSAPQHPPADKHGRGEAVGAARRQKPGNQALQAAMKPIFYSSDTLNTAALHDDSPISRFALRGLSRLYDETKG